MKKYIVAKGQTINDGGKVYTEGMEFPRRIESYIKTGILIEQETEEKKEKRGKNGILHD